MLVALFIVGSFYDFEISETLVHGFDCVWEGNLFLCLLPHIECEAGGFSGR